MDSFKSPMPIDNSNKTVLEGDVTLYYSCNEITDFSPDSTCTYSNSGRGINISVESISSNSDEGNKSVIYMPENGKSANSTKTGTTKIVIRDEEDRLNHIAVQVTDQMSLGVSVSAPIRSSKSPQEQSSGVSNDNSRPISENISKIPPTKAESNERDTPEEINSDLVIPEIVVENDVIKLGNSAPKGNNVWKEEHLDCEEVILVKDKENELEIKKPTSRKKSLNPNKKSAKRKSSSPRTGISNTDNKQKSVGNEEFALADQNVESREINEAKPKSKERKPSSFRGVSVYINKRHIRKSVRGSLVPSKLNSSFKKPSPGKSAKTRLKDNASTNKHQKSPIIDDDGYACSICAKKFKLFSMLDNHKRKEHSENLNVGHKCNYCDKKFAVAIALKQHLKEYCVKIPPAHKRKFLLNEGAISILSDNSRNTAFNDGSSETSSNSNIDIKCEINNSNKNKKTPRSALERLEKSKKSDLAGPTTMN